jgi:ribosome-binding protein aMBF1 (putative translation factor)
MTTFDFPYKLIKVHCPKCSTLVPRIDGRSLRAAREVRGVSLRTLAKKVGYSATYLSDIERNQRLVTPNMLLLYKQGLA